jgi:hypothetical protein
MTATATPPTTNKTAAITIVDSQTELLAGKLDEIAGLYSTALATAIKPLYRTMITSNAIEALERALDGNAMQKIIRLMNTPMGFMTDRGLPTSKDKEPYHVDIVKRCVVEALLKGFMPVNNEFNIIAFRMMPVQNGWRRKCQEIPGITDLRVVPGIPRMDNGQMAVRVRASWLFEGKRGELLGADGNPGQTFPIQTNSYSNADNNTGKALRKAYKAIYELITGTIQTEDYDDGGELPPAAAASLAAPSGRTSLKETARLTNGNGQTVPVPGAANGGDAAPSGQNEQQKPAETEQPDPPGDQTDLDLMHRDKCASYQERITNLKPGESTLQILTDLDKDHEILGNDAYTAFRKMVGEKQEAAKKRK